MDFTLGIIPPNLTARERDIRYRANHPDKVKATRYKVRGTDYLARPVIAWDGEGVTLDDGSHIYTMLSAMSSVDMTYRTITSETGLSTTDCFDFLLEVSADTPKAINIIYGGSYDFNMMLGDLPRPKLQTLYDTNRVYWGEYSISWVRGKSLSIGRREDDHKVKVLIYDIVSFFQRTFVEACEEYLGADFPDKSLIVSNKAGRSTFTLSDTTQVATYNAAELRLLIALFVEFRLRLDRVGLRPSRWDGPGALAVACMQKHRVKDAMGVAPDAVRLATRHAYAGGRFEVLKCGYSSDPAYEYDLNSAYPDALQHVPNLARGRWTWFEPGQERPHFSLVNCTATAHYTQYPAPLWARREAGDVCYPPKVTSWYWSVEADAARAYADAGYGTYTDHGAWGFVEDDITDRPFSYIPYLYSQRLALKQADDGAQIGIKLALNSHYGKCAQKLGAKRDPKTGAWRIPPYHQLEWAGWATASCRAAILRAAILDIDAVIAIETDALFTTRPLSLKCGEALGEWEATSFTALTYAQSGLYVATLPDGKEVVKSRGIDKGTLTLEALVSAMRQPLAKDRHVTCSHTRFSGLGLALKQDFSKWRRWITAPKDVIAAPIGKRSHIGCPTCGTPADPGAPGWHLTVCLYIDADTSHPYPIVWEGDAPVPALEELSQESRERWGEED